MKESLDYMIGFHCAPALMGIKVSNLVSVPRQKGAELDVVLDDYNQQFNARGLFFLARSQEYGFPYVPRLQTGYDPRGNARTIARTHGSIQSVSS